MHQHQRAAAVGDVLGTALGLSAEPNGDSLVLRGADPTDTVWLNLVPERMQDKARVHLDMVDAGTGLLRARDEVIVWGVLADPEGNEFCVFAR